MSPVFFALAGIFWIFVSTLNFKNSKVVAQELEQAGLADVDGGKKSGGNYLIQISDAAVGFVQSIYVGSKLVLTNRHFIWLLPS